MYASQAHRAALRRAVRLHPYVRLVLPLGKQVNDLTMEELRTVLNKLHHLDRLGLTTRSVTPSSGAPE